MKDIITVDLFCGAGGLSKGLLDAGFNVVLGIDWFDSALKTFEKNHKGSKALKLNLFDYNNIYKIKDFLDNRNYKLDVLVGGPPCQGFSLAGKRKEDDERNTLYMAMVETAKVLNPKVVLLENVPSILTLYGGLGMKRIFSDFEKLGYKMSVKVLYAPDYGVPQIRKRAFFVGIKNGKKEFVYPEAICDEKKYISCEDAISDLPSLEGDTDYSVDFVRDYLSPPKTSYQEKMRKNSERVYNHCPTKHTEKTIKNISRIPDGGNYKDLPEEEANKFKYHESLHRYYSKAPSLTIDTGHRTHFHYKYNRIPTVRECARLQSFPDDFIFYGNKQEQYKEVGNAVPPLLGKAMGEAIKDYLKDEQEV